MDKSILQQIRELAEKATSGEWIVECEGDSHVIRMGTAISSCGHYETQHIIRYEHGLYPEDGEQYQEAKANARFIKTANPQTVIALLSYIDQLEAARQWVSVAERLPEEDQLVLVVNGKWFNLRHFCDDTWFNCLSGEGFELNEYTHWMPLPPLPETVDRMV